MKKDKFPGFEKCMELIRKSDPQLQEDGFNWLRPRAAKHLKELIKEFRTETNHSLRCWLLELIGESKLPESFDILKENVGNESESLHSWALIGLKNLDTKEARTELYRTGNKE